MNLSYAPSSRRVCWAAAAESGGLTPTPTPVAPLEEGEVQPAPVPVKPMSTQEVAAYRPAQDPRYDPTEGRSSANALPRALPSSGNDQIDNPLYEQQQHQDISGTAFDQGNHISPVLCASNRQQEFYSSMYGSSMERQPSSAFSDSSLSTLDPTQQQSSEYGMSANPAFSSQPLLGSQQQRTTAPSVAAASLPAFYQGPFVPRKSTLTRSQQLLEESIAESIASASASAPSSVSAAPALSSTHLLDSGSQMSSPPLAAQTNLAPAQIQIPTPAQQAQRRPLDIPPPFSDSEGSVSAQASLADAPQPVPSVLLSSTRSTVFGDGPTFAGSPIFSPSDGKAESCTSEGTLSVEDTAPFSSEVHRQPAFTSAQPPAVATGPMFQDNPIFSDIDEQPQLESAHPPLQEAPHAHLVEQSFADDAFAEQPSAYQSSPILADSHLQQQQQQQQQQLQESDTLLAAEPILAEGPSAAAAPVLAADSPRFTSRPILSSFEPAEPAAAATYTSPPFTPEPAVNFKEALPTAQSPTFHSNPIFSAEPTLGEPQAYSAALMLREPSITLTEPELDQDGLGFSSTPILGTQTQTPQQQAYVPTQLATPRRAEPPPLSPAESEVAFSSQPLLGAPAEPQVQSQISTPMQSEASLALPEQYTADSQVAFSDQPIFAEPLQQLQTLPAAEAATPFQSQPSFALPQQPATFSDQPIFGAPRQQQQQQQQQPQLLYTPSEVPAFLEAETPAVFGSPRFQSRPILGGSTQQAQQAQQAQVQAVSSDNPWADRGGALAEREPSLALLPPVEVPRPGITFHDNSLFESADQPQLQPQLESEGIQYYSSSPLAAPRQQQVVIAQQPASPLTPVDHGITYFNESPLASARIGQHQQFFSPASVPVSVSHVPVPSSPAPSFTSEPTLGPPARPPMDTAQPLSAQLDPAQRAQRSVHFSPTSTFSASEAGSLALYDAPPLGFSPSQAVTTVTPVTAVPIGDPEPLSDPLYDPAQRAVAPAPAPGTGAAARIPALLQPLDDPLYDPVQRRPAVALATHPVRPSILLQPLDDPLYDPVVQHPSRAASTAAAPHAPHGLKFVAAQNSRFPKQQNDPLYDPAAVETVAGQKDVTHRGEQVGPPTLDGGVPQPTPQGRPQTVTTGDFATRPILGGGRRPARTVNLTNIGRPAPAAPKAAAPTQPKAEYELGAADVLPQDTHYVKPTPYAELGAHARSALSGAGWKTTWAMEMDAQQLGQLHDTTVIACTRARALCCF